MILIIQSADISKAKVTRIEENEFCMKKETKLFDQFFADTKMIQSVRLILNHKENKDKYKV